MDDWNYNGVCMLCRFNPGENISTHNYSPRHRSNVMLWLWSKYKKGLSRDREGVSVKVSLINENKEKKIEYTVDERRGQHTAQMSVNQFKKQKMTIKFSLRLINERNKDIYLVNVFTLHGDTTFQLKDLKAAISNDKVVLLKPGAEFEMHLTMRLNIATVGTYSMPVAFMIQSFSKKKHPHALEIVKEIVIMVGQKQVGEAYYQSPFTGEKWEGIDQTVLYKGYRLNVGYPIPSRYHFALYCDLIPNAHTNEYQYQIIMNLINRLTAMYNVELKRHVGDEEKYKDYFEVLLWLNEICETRSLQNYNMENVSVEIVCDEFIKVKVPGLAEKRPSLLVGDNVCIRIHKQNVCYMGIIFRIENAQILIKGVDKNLIGIIKEHSNYTYDIKFELNRVTYDRCHEALEHCSNNKIIARLMPDPKVMETKANLLVPKHTIKNEDFINQLILQNEEQKNAVRKILNCSSFEAPYIVFGPPGTGKTMTIVEAILQIMFREPKKQILVCAPSNAACDMIAQKLLSQRYAPGRTDLKRIYSLQYDIKLIPENIIMYSNGKDKQISRVYKNDIKGFKIIIMTLVHSGMYNDILEPDYIFIDEAAQAQEPEILIPLGLINQTCHIVLAGDPKQLNPVIQSKMALKYGLGISVLERLMDGNELYCDHNENFLTMLKLNYRSHEEILEAPNKFFYNNELTAVSSIPKNDPIATRAVCLGIFAEGETFQKVLGRPVEFYGVFSKERREGKSPSYFNEGEIKVLVKCIKHLLTFNDCDIKESDIGIIAPYIRQVYKIKQKLEDHPGIEIGTTESFQGREKRIIIISTVRGQHSLILYDRKYDLGFVSNEKRFNVAITRAISKLIIIGNPLCLTESEHWDNVIENCEKHNSYYGSRFTRRSDVEMRNIVNRVKKLNIMEKTS